MNAIRPHKVVAGITCVLLAGMAHADPCDPSWSALITAGGTGVSERVRALTVFDDGSGPALYAAGAFGTAGGVVEANGIARWDGTGWSNLTGPGTTGMNGEVRALLPFNDGTGQALYAGGEFSRAGGIDVNSIARWDGNNWSVLSGPSGIGVSNGNVLALTKFNDGSGDALYAAGGFTGAGGVSQVGRIAKWDGSAWSRLTGPLGTGVSNQARALATFNDGSGDALYVGGTFDFAGGVRVNGIAKWNGTEWSGLVGPTGTIGMGGGDVNALAIFDDGSGEALYVAGSFARAGGVLVNRIAKWDGNSWSGLTGPGGPGITGVSDTVNALAVFDDGSGPALYVGGLFTDAGGVTVNGIAKWDGSQWSALTNPGGGTGVSVAPAEQVRALHAFDGGPLGSALYVGGGFESAGGVPVNRIARWGVSRPADLNGDGNIDFFDISLFLSLFNAQDPVADFNDDGLFNFFDVSSFLNAFQAGCL
jgi:trimeric autotransporter adhesin